MVLGMVGMVQLLGSLAVGSEVLSAIPADATPPSAMIVDTIEAGTRGPGPGVTPVHPDGVRCRRGQCSHGRCAHGACRNGGCEVPGCPACCPVRPASFGFYGTQWRTWPGHDVVQAAHEAPAAPVMPPKSEVPTADEESPVPGFEPPAPADEAVEQPPETPARTAAPDESSPAREEPETPAPAVLPEPEKPAAPEKPKAPGDDNLFDEAAVRRRAQERFAMLRTAAAYQERLRQEAIRQQATRVRSPAASRIDARPATASAEQGNASEANIGAVAQGVRQVAHTTERPVAPPATAKPARTQRMSNPLR